VSVFLPSYDSQITNLILEKKCWEGITGYYKFRKKNPQIGRRAFSVKE
jgi:hypothetical protein